MVSETKKQLFGLSATTGADDQQQATDATLKQQVFTTRFIFDLLLSLVVLYFYTVFYVIPHFLITKLVQYSLFAVERIAASERFQSCKTCTSAKVQPITTRIQSTITSFRFYPLLKEKANFVYETIVLTVIELVANAARQVYQRLATISNAKFAQVKTWVSWSVNTLATAKQQVVELKACKQTAQFVHTAIIARAASLYNTQLLVLMTVAKQALLGKLNKRVTIAQAEETQEATPAAASTVQFEELKANSTTSDEGKQEPTIVNNSTSVEPIATTATPIEEITTTTSEATTAPAAVETTVTEQVEPITATEAVQSVQPQEEEQVHQEEQQVEHENSTTTTVETAEPLLQPAAEEQAAPVQHGEEQVQYEEYEQQNVLHKQHASPRKGGKKHKNKNK